MLKMKGRNKNTFANIPILVKGLVLIDKSADAGLISGNNPELNGIIPDLKIRSGFLDFSHLNWNVGFPVA
jgi:hypothetical protein